MKRDSKRPDCARAHHGMQPHKARVCSASDKLPRCSTRLGLRANTAAGSAAGKNSSLGDEAETLAETCRRRRPTAEPGGNPPA